MFQKKPESYNVHGKRPGRKRVRRLTQKQEAFVKGYVKTGSVAEAKKLAGYKHGAQVMNVPAVALTIDNYKKKMELKFMEHGEEMLDLLVGLARYCPNPNVQLGAIKDLLDRSGCKPVERKEVSGDMRVHHELVERYRQIKGV